MFQDGVPVLQGVTVTETGSTLFLQYAKVANTGTYQCMFENTAGLAQQEFHVKVLAPDVNKGIIGAIFVFIFIVVVLIVILARKIYQDKVLLVSYMNYFNAMIFSMFV